MADPKKVGKISKKRSKLQKVAELSATHHPEELNLAASKAHKTSETVNKRKSFQSEDTPIKMSSVEALSLKVQCDLSDEQYQLIRKSSLIQKADIYLNLHEILAEKKEMFAK